MWGPSVLDQSKLYQCERRCLCGQAVPDCSEVSSKCSCRIECIPFACLPWTM